MNTWTIFGSGEYGDGMPALEPGTRILAADGGLAFLAGHGVTPHLIVGDMDSYGGPLPEGVEFIRHPVMKDATDMELSVEEALARGAGRILIYGGLGGRLDHSLANIQLLVRLSRRGVEGYLVGRRETVAAVTRATAKFSPDFSGTVSVFAYGGGAVITERGLLYRLDRRDVADDEPLGVSNEFTGAPAGVEIHEGTAILLWETRPDGRLPVITRG